MNKSVNDLGLPPLNPGWSWEIKPTVGEDRVWLILWDDREKRQDGWKSLPDYSSRSRLVYRHGLFDSTTSDGEPAHLTPRDFQLTAHRMLKEESQRYYAELQGKDNVSQWRGVYT